MLTERKIKSFRVGIAGPVGSGKTALTAALVSAFKPEYPVGVVTNDIYTTEDADFLKKMALLPENLIIAVKTGCCPHSAIREDISANLEAVEHLEAMLGHGGIVFVESGGDNLTATFSYGLIDKQIFVLDIAGGDKLARKGGPGITQSDLLVINKIDLASLVGADPQKMKVEALESRASKPVIMISVKHAFGVENVVAWILNEKHSFQNAKNADRFT